MKNFRLCDVNNDGQLSVPEFTAFLFPQYFEHTHQIHVDNNMRVFDADKNGVITKGEYINELKRFRSFV